MLGWLKSSKKSRKKKTEVEKAKKEKSSVSPLYYFNLYLLIFVLNICIDLSSLILFFL